MKKYPQVKFVSFLKDGEIEKANECIARKISVLQEYSNFRRSKRKNNW